MCRLDARSRDVLVHVLSALYDSLALRLNVYAIAIIYNIYVVWKLTQNALTDEEITCNYCAVYINAIAHVLEAFVGTDCTESHQETFTQVLLAPACVLCTLSHVFNCMLHRLASVLELNIFWKRT